MARNKRRVSRAAAIQAALEQQDVAKLKQLQRSHPHASEFRAVIDAAINAGDPGLLHQVCRLWRADTPRKRGQLNMLWRRVAARETSWQNH